MHRFESYIFRNNDNMLVKILSKNLFKLELHDLDIYDSNVETHSDKAFISILNSGLGEKSHFYKEHRNVLILKFDDITDREKGMSKLDGTLLFEKKHAESIINFVESNKDVEQIYVHCSAGISRSGAVGVFINDLYGIPYLDFIAKNRTIKPNYYILALLRRMYNGVEIE